MLHTHTHTHTYTHTHTHWQLVVTIMVSIGVYVWCEVMPLLAVALFPTSHRVACFAVGLASSKIASIVAYYFVLSWEVTTVVLPYIALTAVAFLGMMVAVVSPDPAASLHTPLHADGAAGWQDILGYMHTARQRVSRLYCEYFEQFFGLHVGMLGMSVLAPFSFGQSKILAFVLPNIRHALSMPRMPMSFIYSSAVIFGAVLQPGAGALVDEYGYRSAFAVASPVLACGMLLPLLAVYLEHDPALGLGMGAAALVLFVALLVIRSAGVALQTTSNALCNQVLLLCNYVLLRV